MHEIQEEEQEEEEDKSRKRKDSLNRRKINISEEKTNNQSFLCRIVEKKNKTKTKQFRKTNQIIKIEKKNRKTSVKLNHDSTHK